MARSHDVNPGRRVGEFLTGFAVTPKSITTRGGARYNMHMHTQSPKTARGVRLYEYIIKTKSCCVSRGGGRDHPQREDQRRPTRTPRTRKNPRTRKSSLVEAMVEGLVLCQKNCITSYERTMCLSAVLQPALHPCSSQTLKVCFTHH